MPDSQVVTVMRESQLVKQCSRCREILPATEEYFPINKRYGHGLRKWCRVCVQEYEAQNITHVGEKRTEYMREYWRRPENKARAKQYNARWYKANFSIYRKYQHARRARERNAEGSHTFVDIEAQYKAQKGKCYYCGCKVGSKYHIDHVVPLSRGGSNSPENLVIACPSCNLSKNNKLPHEWIQGGRLI